MNPESATQNLQQQINSILDSGEPGSFDRAKSILERKIEVADPVAFLLMSELLLEYGDESDAPRALEALRKAAELGSMHGAHRLWKLHAETASGMLKDLQPLVAPDPEAALSWRDKAAEAGHPEARISKAKEAFEKGEVDQAREMVNAVLSEPIQTDEFEPEELRDFQRELKYLSSRFEQDALQKERAAKIDADVVNADPADLYNVAYSALQRESITPDEREQALKWLDLAAQKGLVPARKLAEKVRKSR